MSEFYLTYNKFKISELNAAEKILKCKIPEDLRNFLFTYGSGVVEDGKGTGFLIWPDLSLDAAIEMFCGTKSYLQYLSKGVNNGWWPFMPPKSLPFATGPGVEWGIYYSGPDRGKVFVLKHDEGPEDEPEYWDIENGSNLPYHEYVHVLADSFDELMDQMLMLEDIEDE